MSEFTPAVKYPLRAFLDLSTGHLKPETLTYLNDKEHGQLPFYGAVTAYGWLVYADYEDNAEARRADGCPEEIIAAMKKAREMGAEYILYDCDAEADPDLLPVYDHSSYSNIPEEA